MKFFIAVSILIVLSFAVSAQEFNLSEFFDRGVKEILKYPGKFKNLSAEEAKTNIYFRSDGSIEEQRIIKSLFFVYQSPRNNNIAEFRSPQEFNGKNVARTDEKLVDFFEKLAKADSNEREYKKLREESLRYDGKTISWGMTLFQESPFGRLRPFFKFKTIGREKIEGREAVVIEYTQTKQTTLLKVNAKEEEIKKEPNGSYYKFSISNDFLPTNPIMAGKIWLDSETAQIWRNEFRLSINPEKLTKPVIVAENFYEYQSSTFGILVPKKFRFVSYKVEGSNDKNLKSFKQADRTFTYSKFSEYSVETLERLIGH